MSDKQFVSYQEDLFTKRTQLRTFMDSFESAMEQIPESLTESVNKVDSEIQEAEQAYGKKILEIAKTGDYNAVTSLALSHAEAQEKRRLARNLVLADHEREMFGAHVLVKVFGKVSHKNPKTGNTSAGLPTDSYKVDWQGTERVYLVWPSGLVDVRVVDTSTSTSESVLEFESEGMANNFPTSPTGLQRFHAGLYASTKKIFGDKHERYQILCDNPWKEACVKLGIKENQGGSSNVIALGISPENWLKAYPDPDKDKEEESPKK